MGYKLNRCAEIQLGQRLAVKDSIKKGDIENAKQLCKRYGFSDKVYNEIYETIYPKPQNQLFGFLKVGK